MVSGPEHPSDLLFPEPHGPGLSPGPPPGPQGRCAGGGEGMSWMMGGGTLNPWLSPRKERRGADRHRDGGGMGPVAIARGRGGGEDPPGAAGGSPLRPGAVRWGHPPTRAARDPRGGLTEEGRRLRPLGCLGAGWTPGGRRGSSVPGGHPGGGGVLVSAPGDRGSWGPCPPRTGLSFRAGLRCRKGRGPPWGWHFQERGPGAGRMEG